MTPIPTLASPTCCSPATTLLLAVALCALPALVACEREGGAEAGSGEAAAPASETPTGEGSAAPAAGQSDEEYVEAMAREHAHDSPEASPMAAPPAGAADGSGEGSGAAALRGQSVVFGGSDEAPLRGYLVEPEAADGAPGVVLIHEWWGLNDNIRTMADRLADEGYRALAVDMYGGQVADTPEGARALMESAMADPAAGVAILEAAISYLHGASERVGTIGWCFGGGWSLRAGLTQGEAVDAVVIYYGHVATDAAELAPLEAPVIGFFGADDGGIPVDDVRAFEAAVEANGDPIEIHVYEGAGHAFANPSGHNYQEEPAQDAWRRTLAFFSEHLQAPAEAAP